MPSPAGAVLGDLDRSLLGEVIRPGSRHYDDARTSFHGYLDSFPAGIVRPRHTAEVARVVETVRAAGLPLAVRSGGHCPAGHSSPEGAIVLDLRSMRGMTLDVGARTAWAQTGLTAGQYTDATGVHGLATGFGEAREIGIGGITLGGGIGHLSRAHGLTVDNVLAAEIVTADGRVRHVDHDSEPDLFWALRGGAGNFGIVTKFKYRLHEVATVTFGQLVLPALPKVVTGFIHAAADAPNEVFAMVDIVKTVDADHPIVAVVTLCHTGSPQQAQAALRPFGTLAQHLSDTVRACPYPDTLRRLDPTERPIEAGLSLFVDDPAASAEEVVERVRESGDDNVLVNLRRLGGAIAEVPILDTAFPHRHRSWSGWVSVTGRDAWDRLAWVREVVDLLRIDNSAYVNSIGEEGPHRVRAAYPGETWNRLRRVKARYDPDNMFRHTQNIPPLAG